MSGDKKPGTRKLFCGSIGLLLAGLLLVALGAVNGWLLLMRVGVLGAGVVQLIWLMRSRVGNTPLCPPKGTVSAIQVLHSSQG